MHRTIAGARALVTGASGGLGQAIALELARQGAQLVLLARRADKLQAVADTISTLGGRVETVVGDVNDPQARQTAIERSNQAFGGLDILVNNAGVGALVRFEASTAEQIRRVLDTNLLSPIELTRAALPLLKAGRQPIVVNISSILGHRATPQNSAYCASKFALRGWSDSVRIELAPQGIDLLVVSPGSTATEFWNHLVDRQGTVPWKLESAMPADRVAREIVRAIRRGRRELIPGWRNRWFVRLGYFCPGLLDRVMRRFA
ncbi:MAG TPA: SDR family NAD(P)-dependent oxidoreductase [Pirellulales bacterium]